MMTSMLGIAASHLVDLGVDYVQIRDAWSDGQVIGFVARPNTAPVRIDTLDDAMHLRVRPAGEDGSALGGGLEVHTASPFLIRAAIDAVLAYNTEGSLVP